MRTIISREYDEGKLEYAIEFEDESKRDNFDLQCTNCRTVYVCKDEQDAVRKKSACFCESCGCRF